MKRNRRRRSSAPLTLFSFQDIITCLCGIMILITLLMAISISAREVITAGTEPSDPHQYERVVQLREELSSLLETVQINPEARDLLSPTERAQQQIEYMRAVGENLEQRENLIRRIAEEHARRESLRRRVSALEESLELLEIDMRRLTREIDEAPPAHAVAFIPGEDTRKTPILIECSSKQIRVGVLGQAAPRTFGVSDIRPQLKRYFERFPPRSYFVVFLIKPSGLDFFEAHNYWIRFELGYEMGFDVLEEEVTVNFGRATQ